MTGSKERLGPMTSCLFIVVLYQQTTQAALGLLLSLSYSPAVAKAYPAVADMHHGLFKLIQSFHYWDSALLILESLALVCWMAWSGQYRSPFRMVFWASLLMFIGSEGFQISGNLLPFDRHGVQTAVVESGIAARAPGIGYALRSFILAGPSFSADTVARWFGWHIALVVIPMFCFGTMLWYRREGKMEGSKGAFAITLVLTFALAAFVPSPFGSQATPADYGAFDADVSWYVWPLHGAMRLFEQVHSGFGWIGAIGIPGLLFLFFAGLPLFGDRVSQKVTRVVLGVSGLFFAIAAIGFGGRFSPLTGTRDPIAVGGTSAGPIKPINAALQAQGAKLFASLGCSGCHGPNGDKGGAGPSLKTIGQQHPDSEFYEKYIHNPTAVDSQSTMPAFPNATQQQLQALAEFLRAKR